MTIQTKVVRIDDPPPGSIGRVWKTSGITEFERTLTKATISMNTKAALPMVEELTLGHEMGHVSTAGDLKDATGDDAFAILRASDRWDDEIEAWLRAFEQFPKHNFEAMRFVLDCLNSYRRALDVTDEAWHDMIDVLAPYYIGPAKDLHDYEPLEPDPGEEPPDCVGGWGQPSDEDDDEDDDNAEGAGDEYQQTDDIPLVDGEDMRWMNQDVLDYATRHGLDQAADNYGLDRSRLPALVAGMFGV